MVAIFPSLISANLLNLKSSIELLNDYVQGYHIDIMDFHFVPNLTWGPAFANAITQATNLPVNVHLMVEYPEKYFDRLDLKENDIVSIHIESPSTIEFQDLYELISKKKWIPSIALNPFTPLDTIISLTVPLRHILLMSVNPGFSGQKFLYHTIDKLKALNDFRVSHNLNFTIAMDGGINLNNIKELTKYSVDQVGVASAIFDSKDPVESIQNLINASQL